VGKDRGRSRRGPRIAAWLHGGSKIERCAKLLMLHHRSRGAEGHVNLGLSTPFLLLPYRPNTDPCAGRSFIRNYFNPTSAPPTGANLQQELRLTDPDVLCSALKWCWSRLPGGVVTWEVYELFRQASYSSLHTVFMRGLTFWCRAKLVRMNSSYVPSTLG
jgi:hypothetical protein